jgi:hypothetical protein
MVWLHVLSHSRDLQDEMYPHFHRLLEALLGVVDSVSEVPELNPELTGKLFECVSYLLK